MEKNKNLFENYELIADIFTYPGEELRKKIKRVQNLLNDSYPEAAEIFIPFTNFSETIEICKWEEIYTRSFDVQALTTLDLGYVLFGDDYKRGELLVNLSKEHKEANNPCHNELADHLPNVLRLLGKLTDEDLFADLIKIIIYPALVKIAGEFEMKHIEKKTKIYKKHHRTIIEQDKSFFLIYISPIKALIKMIEKDFTEKILNVNSGKDFSQKISSELEIEKLG
ncbi:MAG: hypothetical protein HND52_11060 [Ignavibacteriae bacterium]|nr:hypothetical protein [Ignavibacteriota bacterium]NOG98487.1 hypothetical protein [Ignavibacteriota bacterium]